MAGSAADWITLAEAAEILEAANVRFRASHDRQLGPLGEAAEHQARRPPLRQARPGPGTDRRPADRPRRATSSPGLFEDWTG